MRAVSLVRAWLYGIQGFVVMTISLAIAFSVAITGPPTNSELELVQTTLARAATNFGEQLEAAATELCPSLPRDAQQVFCATAPQPTQAEQDVTPPQAPPQLPPPPEVELATNDAAPVEANVADSELLGAPSPSRRAEQQRPPRRAEAQRPSRRAEAQRPQRRAEAQRPQRRAEAQRPQRPAATQRAASRATPPQRTQRAAAPQRQAATRTPPQPAATPPAARAQVSVRVQTPPESTPVQRAPIEILPEPDPSAGAGYDVEVAEPAYDEDAEYEEWRERRRERRARRREREYEREYEPPPEEERYYEEEAWPSDTR